MITYKMAKMKAAPVVTRNTDGAIAKADTTPLSNELENQNAKLAGSTNNIKSDDGWVMMRVSECDRFFRISL